MLPICFPPHNQPPLSKVVIESLHKPLGSTVVYCVLVVEEEEEEEEIWMRACSAVEADDHE